MTRTRPFMRPPFPPPRRTRPPPTRALWRALPATPRQDRCPRRCLRRAPPTGASDGPQRHLAGLHLHEKLGRGAEELAPVEAQIEVVRGGAGGAQRPVEREPVAIGQLEPLREDHLEDVAGVDVLEGPPDGRLELLLAARDWHRLGQAAAQEA